MTDDILGRDEELDFELELYCDYDEDGIGSIRHPLVYSLWHTPQQNALVNRALRAKGEAVENARRNGHWSQVIWLHERPWRFDAFLSVQDNLSNKLFWSLLGEIWIDSENIWQNQDRWREILSEPPRPDQRYFMPPEDRRVLRRPTEIGLLPRVFTVYRGFDGFLGTADGFSWTLDEEKARWFAARSSMETPLLARGTVSRRDVFAYLSGRGEQEIVCLPENVHNISIEHIEATTAPDTLLITPE